MSTADWTKIPENLADTPLMKQYMSIKAKYLDAILLFRVGDFYETFGSDAIKASEILGITLTKRANGAASYVDLAGFPYHALDTYLPKLVRAGQRVAICEQLEDPKLAKKIVRRGITELITPGVSLNDNVLNHRENNFLACVHFDKQLTGVAFLDISTGEFMLAEGTSDYVDKLLSSFQPKEVLVERSHLKDFTDLFGNRYYTYKLDDWMFTPEAAEDRLLKHFQTVSLKGFGVQGLNAGIVAAGAILQYLDLTQHTRLDHISKISRIEQDQYVWLDKFTIRNLEIFQTINEGARALIDVLDRTITPMGSRTMKRWLSLPLRQISSIRERHAIVGFMVTHPEFASLLLDNLRLIGDLERLVSKVSAMRVSPRELLQLKTALKAVHPIKEACTATGLEPLVNLGENLQPCQAVIRKIEQHIAEDAPALITKGGVIAQGVSAELDELRNILHSGRDFLLQIQQREAARTGIPSLKVSYNNVFGYFIEVRNTHKDKVPSDWIRKQTLVSAERYITEELKEYESKILGAEEKILELEAKLYNELVESLHEFIPVIQLDAQLLARLDCLLSFAVVAEENRYTCPEMDESLIIDIKEGRHPVIEKMLPPGEPYIANDLFLDPEQQQIIIITGPNMSGKSALLRQTALIVLLAQVGSFVPAASARIGIVDKIFTRVGASDNLSLGESTFMVEMTETASILNNLSSRSLILLDEIGRGTSTYDGISIAWAMVEYIHEHPEARAKTLFATHYHELNEMAKTYPRVKNFNVSVKEVGNKVLFLRKLVPGGSEHSFGIHVARMAGMPKSVVSRANEILKQLEGADVRQNLSRPVDQIASHREGLQLSFFQLDDPVLRQVRDQLKNLDLDNITPIEALNKLNELKKITGI